MITYSASSAFVSLLPVSYLRVVCLEWLRGGVLLYA